MALDHDGLEILTPFACLTLLAGRRVGRVAISRSALPAIVPVTYCVLGDDLILATRTDSVSLPTLHDNVIAFEVDEIDPDARTGWSVLVVGLGSRVDGHDVDWQDAVNLDLKPWAGRDPVDLIRLSTNRISGRRFAGDAGTTVKTAA